MAAVRLTIHGGPFDGGSVEVPRRTPPGLRLSLTSDDVTANYRIIGTPRGTCVVLFEEPSTPAPDELKDDLVACSDTDARRGYG